MTPNEIASQAIDLYIECLDHAEGDAERAKAMVLVEIDEGIDTALEQVTPQELIEGFRTIIESFYNHNQNIDDKTAYELLREMRDVVDDAMYAIQQDSE